MTSPNSIDFVRCMKCGKVMKCSRYDVAILLDHINNQHPDIDIIDTETKRKPDFSLAPINTRQEVTIEDCRPSDEDCRSEKSNVTANVMEGEGNMLKLKWPLKVKNTDVSRYSITSEMLAKYPEIKECEYAPHNPNAKVVYTRRYKLRTPSDVTGSLLQQPFQYTLYRTSIEKWCPANGSIYCPKCGSDRQPLIKTKAERFTRNECGACCLLSCWPFCFIPWILPGQNQEYLYCANCKTFLGLYDRQRNCLKPNRLYTSSANSYPKKSAEPTKTDWNEVEKNKLLENESPPAQNLATGSAKSSRITSVSINGKELPPEAVARLEKYKRFGSMMGIDLNAYTDDTNSTSRDKKETKEEAAPTAAKED